MTREKLIDSVKLVVTLLVEKRYEDLASITKETRLPKNELGYAITRYGGNLVLPPEEAWNRIDVVRITNDCYSIEFDLWTEEEGRSDLTLQITVFD